MNRPDLNPLLSDRTRLLIMAALAAARREVDFVTLTESLGLTRGNLSVHARKLQGAGLLTIKKEFVQNKPRTSFCCTDKGRQEVKKYLKSVEGLLKEIG